VAKSNYKPYKYGPKGFSYNQLLDIVALTFVASTQLSRRFGVLMDL